MEKFAFFPSNNGDRIVQSKEVAEFFSQLFTNGIFNNGCKVVANDNMSITIKKGYAFLNGYFYYNDSDLVLPVAIADANQSRIDNVVLRYSAEDRNIKAQIIQGDYSTNPVAPDLERTTAYYDLRIAQIIINQGIDKISSDMIKDCRFSSTDCGNVVQAVQHLDTNNIFEQYDSAFYDWFGNLKLNLNSNVASNLQNEIDTIENEMISLRGNVNSLNNRGFKVLWENPNKKEAFGAQTIELKSNDYDYLIFIYGCFGGMYAINSKLAPRESGINMDAVFFHNGSLYYGSRTVFYEDDTHFRFDIGHGNVTTQAVNDWLIPWKVLGVKLGGQ